MVEPLRPRIKQGASNAGAIQDVTNILAANGSAFPAAGAPLTVQVTSSTGTAGTVWINGLRDVGGSVEAFQGAVEIPDNTTGATIPADLGDVLRVNEAEFHSTDYESNKATIYLQHGINLQRARIDVGRGRAETCGWTTGPGEWLEISDLWAGINATSTLHKTEVAFFMRPIGGAWQIVGPVLHCGGPGGFARVSMGGTGKLLLPPLHDFKAAVTSVTGAITTTAGFSFDKGRQFRIRRL